MISNWKYYLGGLLLVASVAYASGRYLQPPKVVTKTETVVKEVQVIQHDTTTKTHEEVKPDGTKTIDTVVEDKDKEENKSSADSKASTVVDTTKPQWKVGALGAYDFSTLKPIYGVQVDRRILGPIFVGAFGLNNRTVGLSVSLEF